MAAFSQHLGEILLRALVIPISATVWGFVNVSALVHQRTNDDEAAKPSVDFTCIVE